MSRILGRITLRNPHIIRASPGGYLVEQLDPHRTKYSVQIARKTIHRVYALCRGQTVSSKEAAFRLQPYAHKLRLPYSHGYKLQFYTQEALLVLVAIHKATIKKSGKRYVYTVV